MTEIFGFVNDQPFVGVSVITVGDFFQLPPVGRKQVYANDKNNWQNVNSLRKLFKISELTEVMRQRRDSQVPDLLNNVRTGDVQPDVQETSQTMHSILLRKMQMPTDIMMECWTEMKTTFSLKKQLTI